MDITYLGHAGFCVETSGVVVIVDPWLSSRGAFDSAWFQFPCNHHLAEYVQRKLADASKERYVYISHEHKDHFDPEFLKSLRSRNFKFIVPRFRRPALRAALAEVQCARVIDCSDGEEIPISGGFIKLYVIDTELNRDSTLLIKANGCSFLDVNDCKIYDRLAAIAAEQGPVDVLAAQFSGATWHPTCYSYSREIYESISKTKLSSKFETVARSIEKVRPRVFLPSAGPPCFLDPTLFDLNFEPINIFPRASMFTRFLDERLSGVPTVWPEMMPGDVLSAKTGGFLTRSRNQVSEAGFTSYLQAYAAARQGLFAQLQASAEATSGSQVIERLGDELKGKLAGFMLHKRIDLPLYFALSDFAGTMLRIDFCNKNIDRVSQISDGRCYSISAPAWQIKRVLEGHLTWEDFALTFRMRLKREPDLYQTLIQAFLIMEAEDLPWFCRRMLDMESNQSRLVVEAGGRRYAVDRFCPHEGVDLKEGWVDDAGYLVCARHGWRFDLANGGRCTTNGTSVHALLDEQWPEPSKASDLLDEPRPLRAASR